MKACDRCGQPVRKNEDAHFVIHRILHANPDDCVKATARRCAAISWRAKGFWVAVDNQIRKEFGLGVRR